MTEAIGFREAEYQLAQKKRRRKLPLLRRRPWRRLAASRGHDAIRQIYFPTPLKPAQGDARREGRP